MYLLKTDKLYGLKDGLYKSVDIINGKTVFNGIETLKDTINGQLLTHKEVYCKFHINAMQPTLSEDYKFPRPLNEKPIEEPKIEPIEEPKPKTNRGSRK